MTDMPERIWACREGFQWKADFWSPSKKISSTEYIRADLVAPPEVTDAMVDAAWQEVYAAYGYDADMNMDRLLRAAIQAALGVR